MGRNQGIVRTFQLQVRRKLTTDTVEATVDVASKPPKQVKAKPVAATAEAASATAPVKATRVVPSPQERDAAMRKANQKAKSEFTERFEGAHIPMKTILNNRAVTREFTRGFHISVRNWYTGTNIARTVLGDAALANQVEAGMLKKVKETSDFFRNEVAKCEAIALDAGVDFSLIGHSVAYEETTKIIGPVAMALHGMYKYADKYIDVKQALYAWGQISADESSNSIWEVKKRLQGLAASLRNYRRLALETVNERGKSRNGFKAVATDGSVTGNESIDTASSAAGEAATAELKVA